MWSKSVRLRHPLKGNELSALQKLQPHFSLKCVDAYDDSAVILKWSGQDLQVSHDDMAQYAFLGGKFSSELESFSGGMSGPGVGGESAYERGGDARRKFWIKALKDTDLAEPRFFWPLKETDNIYIFIFFRVQP